MARNCRDCRTCTKPGLTYALQNLAAGLGHTCTVFISYGIKRGFLSHCPQCKHLLSNHNRRHDGSFQD